MIQFISHYSDKSNIQQLEIEIINNDSFINDSYHVQEEESKEIYLLLISDNKKEIQDYLLQLTQDRSC